MRRIGLVLLSVFMLGGVVAFGGRGATAQDATPAPPVDFQIAPGVTAVNVVFVEGQESPALYHLQFDPGVVYPVEPSPNLELIYMVTGSLTLRLDAPITMSQVGATGSTGEAIQADTEVTLTAGQYFVLPPGVSGEVRNDGQETATVSVAGIAPDGIPTPPAASPTAATPTT